MSTEAEERFDDFFNRYHADIFRYCLRRLDRDEAEDATAEVFAVVWRRIHDVPEGETVRSWLMSVAYHTVGNRYRGLRRTRRLNTYVGGLREVGSDASDGLIRGEESQVVLEALSKLSTSDQEILKLVAWDRMTLSEAASVLGIKENTAAQRLTRARARLKTRFERMYEDATATAREGENS